MVRIKSQSHDCLTHPAFKPILKAGITGMSETATLPPRGRVPTSMIFF